jgi:hypothetical protein
MCLSFFFFELIFILCIQNSSYQAATGSVFYFATMCCWRRFDSELTHLDCDARIAAANVSYEVVFPVHVPANKTKREVLNEILLDLETEIHYMKQKMNSADTEYEMGIITRLGLLSDGTPNMNDEE